MSLGPVQIWPRFQFPAKISFSVCPYGFKISFLVCASVKAFLQSLFVCMCLYVCTYDRDDVNFQMMFRHDQLKEANYQVTHA
jgi:hypothetical protein